MRRVPASLALLALRQSGHHIRPSTLRMSVNRSQITRSAGGYDLAEILAYLDRRGDQISPSTATRSSPLSIPHTCIALAVESFP